jgi:hypothetical protein
MSALDELQAVMFKWKDQNSVIKPTLHRRASECYRLQLIEDFDSVDDASNSMPSRDFDDCVKWVESQLKDRPDCKRMAWDMWDFKHRRDAEKFITLFHLLWEQ